MIPRDILDSARPRNGKRGPRPAAPKSPERSADSDGHSDAFEPEPDRMQPPAAPTDPEPLAIITAGKLLDTYRDLRSPLIDGLLRAGETMNVIAPSKVGKSWLTIDLALAVATGRPWLGTFSTSPGRVLLIDNELHRETIAHRLRRVVEARAVPLDLIASSVSILSLRGRLQDLRRLGASLLGTPRGYYPLIVVDAFYRVLPADADENSNATMAMLYNLLDSYADALGAAFILIHHASKGLQSEKAITDVGAGAGAQARATDTHLVLRPHDEPDAFVLDAAVRSWPPVAPRCLRWTFPVWTPAPDLDPTELRRTRPRQRTAAEPAAPWTAERFAATFGRLETRPRPAILADAESAGLSTNQAEKLLRAALASDKLFAWPNGGANRPMLISTAKPPDDP